MLMEKVLGRVTEVGHCFPRGLQASEVLSSRRSVLMDYQFFLYTLGLMESGMILKC